MKGIKPFLIFVLICLGYSCMTKNATQHGCKAKFGDLQGISISVVDFKKQKEVTVTKKYKIDTAIAYFSIPGKQGVYLVPMLPRFDRLQFKIAENLLTPGSSVTFKIICHKKDTKIRCETSFGYSIKTLE